MSMIKIENLTFSYPTSYDNVFENVSFQVDTDWKLGFVGRNGRGKTTFLNLLLGKYEYSGKILSSVQFDYFPYPVSDKNRITEDILQEICPLAEEWELMRELSYLDVDVDVLFLTYHYNGTLIMPKKNKRKTPQSCDASITLCRQKRGNFIPPSCRCWLPLCLWQ